MKTIRCTRIAVRLCLIGVITSGIVITSCQPTPKESAVRSKSNASLEQALTQDAQTIVIDAPEPVNFEYNAKVENTKIIIDAKVTYPKTIERVSVQELTPKRNAYDQCS